MKIDVCFLLPDNSVLIRRVDGTDIRNDLAAAVAKANEQLTLLVPEPHAILAYYDTGDPCLIEALVRTLSTTK